MHLKMHADLKILCLALPAYVYLENIKSGNQREQLNFTPALCMLISGRLHQFLA